jgi:MazG family protein
VNKLSRSKGNANRADDPAPTDGPGAGLPEGLAGLRALMDRLLGEDGCPWDRAQTLATLRPYLLEETCEVLDALDDGDPAAHRDELGDLLFQIVFHSALRERQGAFDLDDVVRAIVDKLVRRHPHVFGPRTGEAVRREDVQRIWAEAKARERAERGESRTWSSGVPRSLPALPRAAALQQRAAQLGFDWPTVDGALEKLHEELGELDAARATGSAAEVQAEVGDLLFVMIRIANKLGVDPDDALRRTTAKFDRRFTAVTRRCAETGRSPDEVGLAQLEAWWQAAKRDDPPM